MGLPAQPRPARPVGQRILGRGPVPGAPHSASAIALRGQRRLRQELQAASARLPRLEPCTGSRPPRQAVGLQQRRTQIESPACEESIRDRARRDHEPQRTSVGQAMGCGTAEHRRRQRPCAPRDPPFGVRADPALPLDHPGRIGQHHPGEAGPERRRDAGGIAGSEEQIAAGFGSSPPDCAEMPVPDVDPDPGAARIAPASDCTGLPSAAPQLDQGRSGTHAQAVEERERVGCHAQDRDQR